MKNNIPKPVRIGLGVVSILYIVYMWVRKDVVRIYASLPPEDALPLLIITVAVFLGKVALLAAVILLLKWISGKIGGGGK